MDSNISNALLLMLIGMSTVYFILFLVVRGGKILIHLLNRVELEAHDVPFTKIKTENIAPSREAVIQNVVHALTNGTGKVDKIEKIK